MKLTKFLALGIIALGLTSCFDDNKNENNYSTYTDYLQFIGDGSKCETDAGESYAVKINEQVKEAVAKLTDGRGLCQFRVEYGADGKMVGGFELLSMADCLIVPGEAKKEYEKNAIQTIDRSYSSVSDKYLNLMVNVGYDGKIDKSKFHLYVSEVSMEGNQIKLTAVYDEPNAKTNGAQAVSFDYRGALASVREQIKPINGKIKIFLTNNDQIGGEVKW